MDLDRLIADIRCTQVLAKLSAFLDGELEPEEVAQLKQHVAECDNCERFGGQFARAVTALRQPAPAISTSQRARLKARLGLP